MLESLIPLGASIIGGLFGKSGQESANETNIALARENRDWQERMSSTAYQRAISDMKNAGLNPMLAYSQGGASTPVGQMPQVQSAVGAGFASAAAGSAVFSQAQQIAQSKAQTDQMIAQTEKIRSETMEKDLNTAIRKKEFEKLGYETEQADTKAQVDRESYPSDIELRHIAPKAASAKSGLDSIELLKQEKTFWDDVQQRRAKSKLIQLDVPRAQSEEDFYQGLGQTSPYLRWLLELLRGVSSAARVR